MCGIVGILERDNAVDRDLLTAMRDRLAHRGPDDAGTWLERNVGLGHRRLSVIDLSREGHQPMASACGRYRIVYNGEIYNFESLRAALRGFSWRGHSDTEVLLAAIATWGIEATLRRLVGMFAFGVYDRERGELTLVRDALGIKPLYYGWCGDRFVFSSELSALDALPPADRRVSRDALATYLRFGNVPAPQSIYERILKLPPGTFVRIAVGSSRVTTPEPFWSPQSVLGSESHTQTGDDLEAKALQLLRDAVRSQLVADVPVGAFLSGGIDSTLVVALMQEQAPRPVRTFTIGFEQSAFDEAAAARRVAAHLGTDHTEYVMSQRGLLEAIAELPGLCDEPFGDSSILPTYLVSRLAREQVAVCLSGDGGDELGWGYTRYGLCESMWSLIERTPRPLRFAAARTFRSHATRRLGRHFPAFGLPGRTRRLSERLNRIGGLLLHERQSDVYLDLVSHTWDPNSIVIDGQERDSTYNDAQHWSARLPMWKRMAVQDLVAYLPDDILTKVDRASMRVGLESRVPLLDPQFVEFCLGLPERAVHGAAEPKRMLKRILSRFVPPALMARPKQGFSVPLADWLRGPLRDWANDLLAPRRLEADGFFRPQIITNRLREHLRREADWSAALWDVLVFQVWLRARESAYTPTRRTDA